MNIIPTKLSGVFIIETNLFQDERGSFVKTLNRDLYQEKNLPSDFSESFYSISKKNVIRVMHFQTPPKDNCKLVFVSAGSILDVVLDIRKGSPTFGQYETFELSSANHKMIYISPGFAHGFLAKEDNTCTNYMTTSTYSKENDKGIKPDSFGMEWNVENPIISSRDLSFPTFAEYDSPFIYHQNENIN